MSVEWIDSEEFDFWNNEWKKCFKCSNCEETQGFESKYCPNCGAKMKKE